MKSFQCLLMSLMLKQTEAAEWSRCFCYKKKKSSFVRSCTHSIRCSHSLLFNYVSTHGAWLLGVKCFWITCQIIIFVSWSEWLQCTMGINHCLTEVDTPALHTQEKYSFSSPVGPAEVWLIVKWQSCSVLQLKRTAFKELQVQEELRAKCKYPQKKVLIYRMCNDPLSMFFRVKPGYVLINNYA